ncbi:hypothetical protein SAMN05445756_1368 [Kytococcus aerolatus]|uniref:YtxH domain-containing protein n=1 Tax=Kytococcus aerolatus TaxID=592308 RepID=A0A212TID4_9MICO|nr:YtxH domain-containing protein [Kytococcus aerolatus]SNC65581.1 hypothetical protein SAMN05445756_1368 [Kytococcus aerolatus]
MKNKMLLLVGTGIGYLLGTRAGREKYDQIVDQAQKLWGDPRVQDAVTTARSSADSAFVQAQDQVKGKVSEAKAKNADADTTGTSSFGQTTAPSTTTGTATATGNASTTGLKGGSTSGFQPTTNTSSFGDK